MTKKKHPSELLKRGKPKRLPEAGRNVIVYLPEDWIEKLDKRAKAEGTSRRELIRELIRAGLEARAPAAIRYRCLWCAAEYQGRPVTCGACFRNDGLAPMPAPPPKKSAKKRAE